MQEQLDATLEALEGLSEAALKEVLASVQKTQGESIGCTQNCTDCLHCSR